MRWPSPRWVSSSARGVSCPLGFSEVDGQAADLANRCLKQALPVSGAKLVTGAETCWADTVTGTRYFLVEGACKRIPGDATVPTQRKQRSTRSRGRTANSSQSLGSKTRRPTAGILDPSELEGRPLSSSAPHGAPDLPLRAALRVLRESRAVSPRRRRPRAIGTD